MKKQRQEKALKRLQNQLKIGTKPAKIVSQKGTISLENIPLLETDIKRIKKEIETLKGKV